MLLVVSASSMVNMNSWYMLWIQAQPRRRHLAVVALDPHVRAR
jgi:hypothetical protein